MTATANRAIWQDACGVPGVIRDNSVPTTDELGDHKVLVKPLAWAINPCDHMLQDQNLVSYPLILGCDVAGTVEAVAPGSTAASHFRVGDRVFGFTANNGFQEYTTLDYRLMSRFPDTMAYREAVVFGLCSATTALLMFDKDYLNLEYPRLDATKRGQSLLVWGGSSAIGSNAIQLATAAGFDVIATCSTNNFEYVRNLGAVEVFDYKDPDVTEKLTAALDQTTCAGVFMAAGGKRGNAAAYGVARRCKQKVWRHSSHVSQGITLTQLSLGELRVVQFCWRFE
ncbi:chaperonin 10-like protein [Xylariomycetidae sp. FL2044]|nr:chaperonin 10-like protein [Xylariomycetidae sp. FL2044]